MIVEDDNVDDLGLSETFHGGPNRAVREFMAEHGSDYALLTELCDFGGPNATWNTCGYWRKLGDG
ncbi:MAG: hypothetical protein ACUVVU_05950 [Tepidimonas sp.]|uniref:hypothetical protein n=1 Tax=Tepidimonas sp. TaxID=2002775 RepID=UPI004054E57C